MRLNGLLLVISYEKCGMPNFWDGLGLCHARITSVSDDKRVRIGQLDPPRSSHS
jgi:hypothetical protein